MLGIFSLKVSTMSIYSRKSKNPSFRWKGEERSLPALDQNRFQILILGLFPALLSSQKIPLFVASRLGSK